MLFVAHIKPITITSTVRLRTLGIFDLAEHEHEAMNVA